ncbi:helix-turn-helix domain-containing protein [Aquimarina algicola]|uniref:AraC family transcriptional regulator n=1 Tax=Aquimarina algicola TaxID=2589995 RepID=A0A504JK32_9FLAO|nr:helix-turn-helix domain-containing protein [Aquimarina algicola]TPN87983.1 AraC family transcriptional regulator [Aquimarina algicola]
MLQKGFILVLSCLGVFQALFLCIYLFSLQKGNRLANRLLALVLLGLTIRIGKSIFHNYIALDPRIRNLAIAAILTVGPFLWWYGKALFQKDFSISKKQFIHLIPFAIYVLCSPIIPNQGDVLSSIAYFSVFLHFGVYIFISYRYALQQKNTSNVKLKTWYNRIVIGVSVTWFLYVGIFFGFIPFYILGAISFSFLVYMFSYLLLKRHVFALEKYRSSTIDRDESQKLLSSLKLLFENEEIYLQQTISLQIIAKKLSISPRQLSQVINENEDKNFSEFVNYYRIQKAKKMLVDSSYISEKIATIAYDCGFGNVTSFNLAFKKETKYTPSQYKKQFCLNGCQV